MLTYVSQGRYEFLNLYPQGKTSGSSPLPWSRHMTSFVAIPTRGGFWNDYLVRQIWIKSGTFKIFNDSLKFGKILVLNTNRRWHGLNPPLLTKKLERFEKVYTINSKELSKTFY